MDDCEFSARVEWASSSIRDPSGTDWLLSSQFAEAELMAFGAPASTLAGGPLCAGP